jgi:hypothetical protein
MLDFGGGQAKAAENCQLITANSRAQRGSVLMLADAGQEHGKDAPSNKAQNKSR